MPYSNEVYNIAADRLSERRQNALRLADYRREQLFTEFPRLREINSELMSIGASIGKCIVKGSSQPDIRELSERSLSLQAEQDRILADMGIDSNVLQPEFTCPVCGDTGHIELENRTVVCDCFKKLMADVAAEQLNTDLPLDRCTFETFKLDHYSDKPDQNGRSPLDRMSKIYNYCVDYADNFTVSSKSLFMRGATGLGKTHLSLTIANEVIKKGMSVIYVSAPDILSKLEREHFTYQYSAQEDTFNSLIKSDLLIIDDLGTEFSSQFTVSCLYNLFNSRLLAGKPVIINTNLRLSELVEAYSQRFVSRVLGSCDRLEFIGEDIRTLKQSR